MSIFPLEQFETDLRLADEERALYEKLRTPKTVVVRFGAMRLIGEYPYLGRETPGCGSKLLVRTYRGTEIGEMLTSTCANAGCGKSVTRQEMLDYIERSGGRDYPFFTDGKALRLATVEELSRQSRLDESRPALVRGARARVEEIGLPMRIVEADPVLGGERLTFYFTAEERVDFRELVRALADEHKCRIVLRQVGARDEARLIADYERCGQHCCCKQFLKVLKPVSMRSAKIQKATLDPLKISGRCGRLMCCLRYEDETYETLRKKLPHRKTRVGTPEGPGIVVDTQILTQLALVELDADRRRVAVPIEELGDPDAPIPAKPVAPDPLRGMDETAVTERSGGGAKRKKRRRRSGRRSKGGGGQTPPKDAPRAEPAGGADSHPASDASASAGSAGDGAAKKKRRRRRGGRRGRSKGGSGGDGSGGSSGGPSAG